MRAARILLVAMIAASLTGCATPAPATEAPAGITVNLHQTRPDLAVRKLEVAVTNGTDSVLSISRLVFESTQFAEPVAWAGSGTSIRPNVTADLPVLLPEPACGDDPVVAVVEFDYTLADGRSGTARITPTDEFARMPELALEDCFDKSITDVATIEATTAPRITQLGGATVAQYDLTITPTGAPGTVTIDRVLSAILIAPADPATGVAGDFIPLDVTIAGTDAPSVLTLTIVANRCDVHAIAEDKRGTFLGLNVTNPDGVAGTIFIIPTDAVKESLYAFVREVCA
ncbi:MAG: hypothetical protein BGO97_00140 [Micrococcales bacterium 70-64]|nr:hypothetical protein [Leifsonia sp.]ODU65646.1 MAG: hypothetical protein ABT06_00140 [Leifsonia sp. SCN 70-46]OJX84273.1 MAG: hypothetical protein BGO97_00140 [Micrococcales bacterium 70-64]